MNIKKNNLIIPLFSSILTISLLIILVKFFKSFSDNINNKFYDYKIKTCGKLRPDKYNAKEKIVTVSLEDGKTIPQIGYPSLFVHAKMIEKLKKYKVKSILYDFIFFGMIPNELIKAANSADNIFWPVSFYLTKNKKEAYSINRYRPFARKIIKKNSIYYETAKDKFFYAGFGIFPNEELTISSKGVGQICTSNDEKDKNSIFRKALLVINIDGYILPSINLFLICDYLQVPFKKIIIEPGECIILPKAKLSNNETEDITIPINDRGEMWINYIKPWSNKKHKLMESFSFTKVLNPEEKPEQEKHLQEQLKNKICLVGNALSASKDMHKVPIDNNYPGIGIHSHIIYTILSRNFIRPVSSLYMLIIFSFILPGISYIINKHGSPKALIIYFGFIIGYLIISYTVFIFSGIVLHDFIPLTGFLLFGILNFIIGGLI
ncbi:CHASE2 domain-containing protein [Candidatus Desantisbacteria bacterium]|nr:CHASE2 domain-containing protein [Candidatus Desantisbacteria bacterium]